MASLARPGFGHARALRQEIIRRNQQLVKNGGFSAVSSYGSEAVVVYLQQGNAHGNFFPQSYAAILESPEWHKRLEKPHTGRRKLPRHEDGQWRELDSCTSSDALLMNIFCHPVALAEGKLRTLMGVDSTSRPQFGVRVAARLQKGHRDRTEVDMRLGDLLVEAKLTESDFQSCAPSLIEKYSGFDEVFDRLSLPRVDQGYGGYQLLRNVLAANACDARFCVIADARRPDLREQWFAVMRCIRNYDLRLRCQMLTWQEISGVLPEGLRRWLEEKYGIFAPGTEPQVDVSEWYW